MKNMTFRRQVTVINFKLLYVLGNVIYYVCLVTLYKKYRVEKYIRINEAEINKKMRKSK